MAFKAAYGVRESCGIAMGWLLALARALDALDLLGNPHFNRGFLHGVSYAMCP